MTTTAHMDIVIPASRNRHLHQVSDWSDHAHAAKDFVAHRPYSMWKDAGREPTVTPALEDNITAHHVVSLLAVHAHNYQRVLILPAIEQTGYYRHQSEVTHSSDAQTGSSQVTAGTKDSRTGKTCTKCTSTDHHMAVTDCRMRWQ